MHSRQRADKTSSLPLTASSWVQSRSHWFTQEYNLALGEKRANTVKNYLNALGVDTSRLVTRSKGENEPRCMNQTEDCWSKNRRVELIQD